MEKVKGELNGKCNITRCQSEENVTWYNHSTRKYYCESCAKRLNNDEFNKRDAMRLFGHDLCTQVVEFKARPEIEPIIDVILYDPKKDKFHKEQDKLRRRHHNKRR